VIEGFLYGVSPVDAVSVGSSVLILVLAAVFASFLPAFKAVRINLTEALRE
jgi:ABC-type antimicrobial peptide transport system permease subunit